VRKVERRWHEELDEAVSDDGERPNRIARQQADGDPEDQAKQDLSGERHRLWMPQCYTAGAPTDGE